MSSTLRWMIAFDIGGTSTKLALVSEAGEMRAWTSLPTLPSRDAFLDRLSATMQRLAGEADVAPSGVAGAIAGFLDADGRLAYNPNLAWLEGTDLGTVLTKELRLPVHLENDANAACAGEFVFGAGRASRRFLCLTAGTGIGVGFIAAGELLRCAWGGLGDAGHVVVLPDGPSCSCGGRGCAEALVSTVALAQQHSDRVGYRCSFRNLVEAVGNGDIAALATVADAGQHLGIALASLAQILFPDCIAVAGGLSALGEPLLASARASFASHAGMLAARATIVRAGNGAHASLVGAVASMRLAHWKLAQP